MLIFQLLISGNYFVIIAKVNLKLMLFFLAALRWIFSFVKGLSPVVWIAVVLCHIHFPCESATGLHQQRSHMITASKAINIPANKYTDLKVEGINLVFLYIETRQFCLINYACVCVIPCPDICCGQLSDLQGSPDLPHTLYQIWGRACIFWEKKALHYLFFL